jgi:Flp pilus assembly protein TadD
MSRIYDHLKSLETQIEQEKLKRGQTSQRVSQEEQRRLQAGEQARLQETAIEEARRGAAGTISTAGRSMKDSSTKHMTGAMPPLPARNSSYKSYFAVILLVIGAGMAAVSGLRLPSNKKVSEFPVAPVAVEQAVPMAESNQGKVDQPAQKTIPTTHEETHLAVTSQKQSVEKMASKDMGATNIVAAKDAGVWESRSSAVREQLKAEAYAEAGRNAEVLARDFPERWEPWFWLGTAQLAQGQMDAAETALDHASRIDSKVARVWIQRAVVAQERGDHVAAVNLLNKARDLSPKSPQIYLNLGYSNDALNLSAEAETNYRLFLSLTEGDGSYSAQRKHVIKRLGGKH